MDFDDSPEEAAFRKEAQAFLNKHAKRRGGPKDWSRRGEGVSEDDYIRNSKQWQRKLYDQGWAGITWPREFGGRGGSPMESSIFNAEAGRYDVSAGTFTVAIGMAGPTIMAYGTDAQKQRYLDPMLRGDEIWCQLFSEPGAGSDLAGLSTKAVLDGDEWIVNGQKVWTSGAHHSDWGILLTRTDPDQPKHRGITYFLVDMRTPGIDIRPLRQINGAAHFNEVFLTDVRIPAENMLGPVHGGWGPTLVTLANERTAIGGSSQGISFDEIADHARGAGVAGDRNVRQQLAATYTRFQLIRYLSLRVQTAISRGEQPGPESSILKLSYSQHLEALGNLGVAIAGAAGMLSSVWSETFLTQWAARIGGGTDQVQRNIVGERVLGLPGEARLDKAVPFNQIGR